MAAENGIEILTNTSATFEVKSIDKWTSFTEVKELLSIFNWLHKDLGNVWRYRCIVIAAKPDHNSTYLVAETKNSCSYNPGVICWTAEATYRKTAKKTFISMYKVWIQENSGPRQKKRERVPFLWKRHSSKVLQPISTKILPPWPIG